MATIPRSFFCDSDVVAISRRLLGKCLFTYLPVDSGTGSRKRTTSVLTGGIIVETEAYAGIGDRASHAYGNRRTLRTETMYRAGGIAYIYLCYGIHALLNAVTAEEGTPHAILIRAIMPTHGIETMLLRRGLSRLERRLTAGPGALTAALGINVSHNGSDLTGNEIWIEDEKLNGTQENIISAPRIGVSYAGTDAALPWRFFFKHNPWVSTAVALRSPFRYDAGPP